MKIERTKNAGRNIFFGTILNLYNIIMPFAMRTVMIYAMGVQYLGLSSLFSSILHVLNLTELGVGSAMVYSMYKPIAEDDSDTICALMKLYRLYYRVIGLVIATVGIAITPFIPTLVKSDLPAGLNIYVLYWMNLSVTVVSYWLFAYKNSLLQAHQRNDVASKVSFITNTVRYGFQIIILIVLKNYYAYLMVALATQILTNIVTAFVTSKLYPKYKPVGNLPKDVVSGINRRIRDLFTSKIGGVVVNSADTIVISAFLGLTILAEYQNYFYIISSVLGVITVIFRSCTAGIGNSLIVETKEKNFSDFKKLTFLISWIATVCSCCFLCLFQPFMELWVGKEHMFEYLVVVFLVIYYYIYEINQLLNVYKDAGGIWHQDRFRPLITAIANLIMNIIMVQFWGLYGIVLSTVLSMLLIGMPWIIYNLFTTLFEKKHCIEYLKKLFSYIIVAVIICVLTAFICSFINFGLICTLIIRAFICISISSVSYVLAFYKTIEYKGAIKLLDTVTRHKLPIFRMLGA